MKEFMLLFRADYGKMQHYKPEDWQAATKKWKDWTDRLIAKGKWVAPGTQLSPNGKIVKSKGVVTDGPYAELKESLLSYCIMRAESLEEAVELSKDCPIFQIDGSVEVRERIGS